MFTRYQMEIEIRTIDDVASNAAGEIAGVTVITDELHPNQMDAYQNIRLYIHDTHDAAFDLDVQHTYDNDTTFSGRITESTVSLTTGTDRETVMLTSPVGRLRFNARAGALASAPTTGSLRFEVIAND